MTVIVWDGKTLAADKRVNYGGLNQATTKIGRFVNPKNELYAITGNLSVGCEMIEWYRNGAEDSNFPSSNRDVDKGCSLIIIDTDGVWRYESGPIPYKIEGPFCAFGSGCEVAYGALEMGADAKRAVEITCKYINSCGNGIDTLTL